MDCKAVEATYNINNALGPGTANEHTGRWWSRSFAKETRAWKWGVQWPAIESLRWPTESHHQSWFSANNMRSWPRTQCQPFYGHLKQIGNVKNFVSVCLMSWPQTEKFVILKCLLLFYATTSHFSTGLWRAVKSEFYTTTSNKHLQWLDREKAPKHFPRTHLHQK